MGNTGKIIGGGIGFVLGGPWGALAGATVGHLFDNDDGNKKASYVQVQNREHYETLNCSPGDSNEAVKAQYRKMVKEFHPDTIAAKHLPDDAVVHASKRFHAIRQAWEIVRKERNI